MLINDIIPRLTFIGYIPPGSDKKLKGLCHKKVGREEAAYAPAMEATFSRTSAPMT
jgi:hypothetical protein